jgi:hypothetical protein
MELIILSEAGILVLLVVAFGEYLDAQTRRIQ